MTNPSIAEIKSMQKEELDALNRRLARKLGTHIVGLLFIKLAAPKVIGLLAAKALIKASKKL